MTKLINETDPDLIVFDPSYTNNDDPHYAEGVSRSSRTRVSSSS